MAKKEVAVAAVEWVVGEDGPTKTLVIPMAKTKVPGKDLAATKSTEERLLRHHRTSSLPANLKPSTSRSN